MFPEHTEESDTQTEAVIEVTSSTYQHNSNVGRKYDPTHLLLSSTFKKYMHVCLYKQQSNTNTNVKYTLNSEAPDSACLCFLRNTIDRGEDE